MLGKLENIAVAVLEQEREALRNVTADPAIAAALTPEQLKAVMPDILK